MAGTLLVPPPALLVPPPRSAPAPALRPPPLDAAPAPSGSQIRAASLVPSGIGIQACSIVCTLAGAPAARPAVATSSLLNPADPPVSRTLITSCDNSRSDFIRLFNRLTPARQPGLTPRCGASDDVRSGGETAAMTRPHTTQMQKLAPGSRATRG